MLMATGLVMAACGHPAGSPPRAVGPAPSSATSSSIPVDRPTTTTTARPAAPPTSAPCTAGAVLGTWSVARRAAQLVVAPVNEDDVAAAEPLVAAGVGGLILFGSAAPSNLAAGLESDKRLSLGGLPPLVMSDEEGGGIQRMSNLVGSIPWPRTMAATMTPSQVQEVAQQLGEKMRAQGVNMDLAPVLDLSDSPGPDDRYPDGPRSFSLDPTTASAYGLAFARGLQAGNVIPVVKHFPGLGQASYNTDFGPAGVPPLDELRVAALIPFEAAIAAGLPAIMVSNASIPGVTGGLPTSLSSAAMTGLLRGQLGFKGLIVTDSLSAAAIHDAGYSVVSASVRSIEAGADLVLFGPDNGVQTTSQIIAAIVAAVSSGAITQAQLDEAVQQVLTVKGVQLCST
jgi:beta-N-acetylhexosaminidase